MHEKKPLVFLNPSCDAKKLELPILKPANVTFLSRFYRDEVENSFFMEFVYKGRWIPTWKLTRERIDPIVVCKDYIDVCFVVTVKEGTILKRVVKEKGKTTTSLFLVTRFGLLELLYDYERGVYVLKDSLLQIPDSRRATRGD